MHRKLIVILGPTGVGKSALCMKVAKHLGVPVINCDSRQMYRELPIGTAAPTAEDMQQVHHYFVGNLSIHDYYSASKYEEEVMTLLADNPSSSGNTKVAGLLSGGSMMYIDAVCKGIDDIPTVRDDIRQELLDRYAAEGIDKMRNELRLLDPEYYSIVDLKNPKRIIHALEICYQTGHTYTSFRTNEKKERPFQTVKIGLNRDRDDLYNRINKRVYAMIDQGMVEEARKVYPYRGLNSLNTVGYKELFLHFDGVLTLDEAIEKIQNNSRKYARKQLTWFRRDNDIKWYNPDDEDKIISYIDMAIQAGV
ncbi:MAG: tRNA (adenosine(37)-N6)-dimethylallyltransferase MiaA [Bacteroidaceae bacterium]|nr:tRNA (adenosine(37)-N6)-dimethylallyltransferase MiaA [Bacteroidaceae bacterium]